MSSRPIKSKDAVVGRVLWLPPFDELPFGAVDAVGQTPAILKEAFDHPVVICSRPADRNGEYVHFHIVTSFHNKSLAERFNMKVNKQRRQVNWYLPIAPSEYHPEETEGRFGHPHIELENGRQMSTRSFINAKDIYAIQWRHLTRYQSKGLYRLTASSIEHMNERTGRLVTYQPGDQYGLDSEVDSGPESPPARPVQTVSSEVPPLETLPPVDQWTRVDVVAPFRLAGGNKAVVFVGTLTTGDNGRSQVLCIIPERNLQSQQQQQQQPEPQTTISTILATPFKTVGHLIGTKIVRNLESLVDNLPNMLLILRTPQQKESEERPG
ncbi:hypothetical protein K441DRAFT_665296 [Neofusicoccum parvum]|nr:hypothetical protein K441DRAFT_665296 [Neofusicoccum parvum]